MWLQHGEAQGRRLRMIEANTAGQEVYHLIPEALVAHFAVWVPCAWQRVCYYKP